MLAFSCAFRQTLIYYFSSQTKNYCTSIFYKIIAKKETKKFQRKLYQTFLEQ